MVPNSGTDDLYVFKETDIIRISDGKWHIRAMISTPKIDSPEVVVRKLIEVFTQFEKYR